ncbi:GNAT family N-acetyltransferase [Micromonospora sp. B11E3]|uniref:GNAT family N-acetyltransferase n=1 Tax=Micromonospora sp. B11E3 TaxID=3153562 RepID=UPI00325E5E8C
MPSSPRLEQITPDTVEAACELRVRPDQEHLVEPVATSLAEAYAWGEIAWPRLVYDGDELVGFLMGFFRIQWRPDDPTDLRSGLWRLNIAADRQGRGYGRFAVRAVCEEARRRGETTGERAGARNFGEVAPSTRGGGDIFGEVARMAPDTR